MFAAGYDYRGTKNVSKSGLPCQAWSDQWPNTHSYTVTAYPDGGLGGHNYCRNPNPADGSTSPWCLIDSITVIWEYCDVGTNAATCASPYVEPEKVSIEMPLGEWYESYVYEHSFHYFKATIPKKVQGIQIVLVPTTQPAGGDPDMFISFDVEFPSGHNYSYVEDRIAVDTFKMSRGMYGFCGAKGDSDNDAECTVYIAITAFESSNYRLVVQDIDMEGGLLCSPGCEWSMLGDGDCQSACNTSACLFDRADCTHVDAHRGCKVDCKLQWVGDGQCDEACFNEKCQWDGGDCGGTGCADSCLPKFLADGDCDEECNIGACGYDGPDCFHESTECFAKADGSDYRGTISHTKSGHVCQKWSQQFPKVPTRTADHHPEAGLGGHNYCRNPDGEQTPWFYPVDLDERWEPCDVGEPNDKCSPHPPPPPKLAPKPPPPPHPEYPPSPSLPPNPPASPPPSPPAPCPEECVEGGPLYQNNKCDLSCNMTTCLWDKGECEDIMQMISQQAGISQWLRPELKGWLYDGDLAHKALSWGVIVGIIGTLGTCCVLCVLRRYKRKIIKKPARAYTAYGEAEMPDTA